MSDFRERIDELVTTVSDRIQKSWPLYAYVTANPLSGFEDRSFSEALEASRGWFGGHGYPTAGQFRQALETDRIDRDELRSILRDRNLEPSPEQHLDELERAEQNHPDGLSLPPNDRKVNQLLEKWLSVYLDEGSARWSMPDREEGFYASWIRLAPYDHHLNDPGALRDLPDDPYDALKDIFDQIPASDWREVVSHHLSMLPGWVGYIKHRLSTGDAEDDDRGAVHLVDYLAVRLILADHLNGRVVPDLEDPDPEDTDRRRRNRIRRCFLEAWETTAQKTLLDRLSSNRTDRFDQTSNSSRPDAQFVFCIDTRSEIIRRHIESTGHYETHGYAGFFGVPIRRRQFGASTTVDACPPIVEPEHYVEEKPRSEATSEAAVHRWFSNRFKTVKKTFYELKDNMATAFSFVELSGVFYGLSLLARTFWPGLFQGIAERLLPGTLYERERVFVPDLKGDRASNKQRSLPVGIPFDKQVQYARSAFELMGWKQFAPVVVFAGHEAQTTNNPFDSSLRCGACAGSSGVPNAKVLADICNREAVREQLTNEGIEIPDDTVFVAARHNTTTDEVTLLTDHVPSSVEKELERIRRDLTEARHLATAERVSDMPDVSPENSARETRERSLDWAQTRPEWGLAGNAAFFIGPTEIRSQLDLDGRVFLHSYRWERDEDGSLLEEILKGPMVVCQWINHQYYFSTVDNGIYGSGSKITQNPVGHFGVVQGNGGDLMSGLPLQSLMWSDTRFQHEPLRLTNIIHAPADRVRRVLQKLDSVRQVIEHEWMYLFVMDPEQDGTVISFQHLMQDREENKADTKAARVQS